MGNMKEVIKQAFKHRSDITPATVDTTLKEAISETLQMLDSGRLRVAEQVDGNWIVHQWLKKAILLSFHIQDNQVMKGAQTNYYDKVGAKFYDYNSRDFHESGIRVVPPAMVKKGVYIAPGVTLMPSFCNTGAYVDSGSRIDTWATIGCCAQICKNVHIADGVGIGGTLESLQTRPTIIEDNCFIGSHSQVSEGVIVEQGSIISMGVCIGQSTRIYNRMTKKISYGRVPAGSVVVAGNLPSDDGTYSLNCAVIVKQLDLKARANIDINELLRNI